MTRSAFTIDSSPSILATINSLYYNVPDIHDVSTPYIINALDSEILSEVFAWDCHLGATRPGTHEALYKCPPIERVAYVDFGISWTAISRPEKYLAYKANVTLTESEVQVGCQALEHTIIVLEHVLNYIVRLMNTVPFGVLIYVLHFDW